jgi:hypothetical protein
VLPVEGIQPIDAIIGVAPSTLRWAPMLVDEFNVAALESAFYQALLGMLADMERALEPKRLHDGPRWTPTGCLQLVHEPAADFVTGKIRPAEDFYKCLNLIAFLSLRELPHLEMGPGVSLTDCHCAWHAALTGNGLIVHPVEPASFNNTAIRRVELAKHAMKQNSQVGEAAFIKVDEGVFVRAQLAIGATSCTRTTPQIGWSALGPV